MGFDASGNNGSRSFISTHDIDSISDELGRKVRMARWCSKSLDTAIQSLPDTVEGVPTTYLKRFFRSLVERAAVKAAARTWLMPQASIEEFDALLTSLKTIWVKLPLDHMSLELLCDRIQGECELVAQQYPSLRRHTEARLAELSHVRFGLRRGGIDDDAFGVSQFGAFQHKLLSALITGKESDARDVVIESLKGSAVQAKKILSGSASAELTHFSTHLLTPVTFERPLRAREVLSQMGEYQDSPGARAASELWSDFPEEIRSVLRVTVQIGRGQNDIGFWIPTTRCSRGHIPGAPEAINLVRPAAVFIDDLPDLPFDCVITNARWLDYMHKRSSARMMLAFPVLIHSHGDSDVRGVVTVNVTNECWLRAYSRSWLREAWKRVSHWHVTAYHAFGLVDVIGGRVSRGVFVDAEVGDE